MDILESVTNLNNSSADFATFPSAALSCPQCVVSIQNADQIAASYGSAALVAARHWALVASEIVAERCGAWVSADWDHANAVFVSLSGDFAGRSTIGEIVETLLITIASQPVRCGDQSFHVAPSLDLCGVASAPAPASGEASAYNLVPAQAPFGGEAVEDNEEWRARYRRDMDAATALFADMRAGNLTLATQPVCLMRGGPVGGAASYIYKECLLRRKAGNAVSRQIGLDILAVERIGLARVLDNFVVHAVIERLEAEPDVRLGANISAQSAVCDSWWMRLCEDLQSRSDVAERLVIEITETASLASLPAATDFALRMKGFGSRIAMDDFGVGRDAIRNLVALAPDIVKVDALFVRRARNSDKDRQALKAIVGLCGAFGGVVVAEGVETAADSEIAARAGAVWQQGYFISSPTMGSEQASEARLFHEPPPTFGRRRTPIEIPERSVDRIPLDENGASVDGAFRLSWLRWAMPLSLGLWLLIAITAYADDAGSDTRNYTTGTATDDTSPLLKGTVSGLQPGDVVKIYEGATYLGDVTVAGGS